MYAHANLLGAAVEYKSQLCVKLVVMSSERCLHHCDYSYSDNLAACRLPHYGSIGVIGAVTDCFMHELRSFHSLSHEAVYHYRFH
jgi:hypothetical protein